MSAGKFASMTASLLARKGDAQPSALPENPRGFAWAKGSLPPPSPPAVHHHFEKIDIAFSVPPTDMRAAERGVHVGGNEPLPVMRDLREQDLVLPAEEKRAPAKAREPERIEKARRLVVSITPEEYARLGIVAVKQDSSRHQLLRDALSAFLQSCSKEYDCACVSGGGCKGSCEA
jgi:hypothetical protein